MTGTPAEAARLRAVTLLPRRRMISEVGPMNTMPAASQASAKTGFSERKP